MRPFLLSLLFFGGCALPQAVPQYREAAGVIHIHTAYSDGTLPIEPVAEIGRRQGLDFLIVTDHNTLRGRTEGKAGWYGNTLVLVDTEISTANGHYLALRLKEEVPSRQPSWQTVRDVARQKGLGFIAHPFWKKKPWTADPDLPGIRGMEIYNLAEDLSDENPLVAPLCALFSRCDPLIARWIDRPDRSLALWDRLLGQGKRIVGIGGADAHGLAYFGFRLGPYETVFKAVRDHLLVRGEITPRSIYEALENGRLFVAHDIVADARGFTFTAVKGEKIRGTMGGRVRLEPGLRLQVHLPSPGRMTLFLNGRPAGTREGREGRFDLHERGIYRIEAARKGRPWIYSNPIDVLE